MRPNTCKVIPPDFARFTGFIAANILENFKIPSLSSGGICFLRLLWQGFGLSGIACLLLASLCFAQAGFLLHESAEHEQVTHHSDDHSPSALENHHPTHDLVVSARHGPEEEHEEPEHIEPIEAIFSESLDGLARGDTIQSFDRVCRFSGWPENYVPSIV